MAIGVPDYPYGLDTYSTLVEATNNAQTTLSSTLNVGVETINVVSTAGFPNTGILRIDSELIAYTSKTSTQFTVQTSSGRGYESTVDAQHSSGASVELVITAYSNNAKNIAIVSLETKLGVGDSTPSAPTYGSSFLRAFNSGETYWTQNTTADLGYARYDITSVATTTLTSSSPGVNEFYGTPSALRTVRLPVTLSTGSSPAEVGQSFVLINLSNNVFRVFNSANTEIGRVDIGQVVKCTCSNNVTETVSNWLFSVEGYLNYGYGTVVRNSSLGDGIGFLGGSSTSSGHHILRLTPATLTSSRTITFPDLNATVITNGDTGTVTSTMIANNTIVDDDINASAGIAPTKLNVGSGVATFLTTPTSANLAAAVTDETGSGALVFGTSPSLTTPNIGVASGTSFNSITGLSSTTPAANSGAGSVGTGTSVARADHVHPTTGLGLTSGGLDQFAASTTNTVGVGNIELGHASDTTLSRASAGVVNIEGVPIVTTTATQTLTNKTLSAGTLTGTLTAGGGVGTSGQALTSTGSGVQWSTISVATPATYNFFDNGNFEVSQRNFAPVVTNISSGYLIDRWFIDRSVESYFQGDYGSASTSTDLYFWRCISVLPGSSGGGSVTIGQRIEAEVTRKLYNDPHTVSANVLCTQATTLTINSKRPAIANVFGGAVSSNSAVTISIPANVSTRVSATFAGTADVQYGLEILFNFSSNTSNVVQMTAAQLEVGSTATPFVQENYATNLVRCMRYYQRLIKPRVVGQAYASSAIARLGGDLPVRMRVAPTRSISGIIDVVVGGGASTAVWDGSSAGSNASNNSFEFNANSSSLVSGQVVVNYIDGSNTFVVTLSAEL